MDRAQQLIDNLPNRLKKFYKDPDVNLLEWIHKDLRVELYLYEGADPYIVYLSDCGKSYYAETVPWNVQDIIMDIGLHLYG